MRTRCLESRLPHEYLPPMYIDHPQNQAPLMPFLPRPLQLLERELVRMIDHGHCLACLLFLDKLLQKCLGISLKSVEITLLVHDLRNTDLFRLLQNRQHLLNQRKIRLQLSRGHQHLEEPRLQVQQVRHRLRVHGAHHRQDGSRECPFHHLHQALHRRGPDLRV